MKFERVDPENLRLSLLAQTDEQRRPNESCGRLDDHGQHPVSDEEREQTSAILDGLKF